MTAFNFKKMAAAGALITGMAFAPGAMAEDVYFGANVGKMMFDGAGYDDPTNVGVLIGAEWGVVAGDVGIQAELTTTLDDGAHSGDEVTINTQAIYGAFRTAGPVYLIAKAGVLREKKEIGPFSDTDSGLAGGVGIGFSLGIAQLELEYTVVEQDVSYLSLGVRF